MNRRIFLSAAAALPLLTSARAAATGHRKPGIAVSIDDFDLSADPLMTGMERDAAIRAVLARHGLKAAVFPAGKYIDNPLGRSVLDAWGGAGHVIGNHTYSHKYYSGADPDGEMADILRCEALLAENSAFRKLLRFPLLAEGKTAEGRDALRILLRGHGYRTAPVTIDTSDWYIDQRMVERLKRDGAAPIDGYRRYYLAHLMDRADYYDGLAKAVFGRSIDHILLLHHKATTAAFLDAALTMFRRRGWKLVDAASALQQPELALTSQTLPAGQSLLWALAKERGVGGTLRYPGEDGVYEKAAMDALGL